MMLLFRPLHLLFFSLLLFFHSPSAIAQGPLYVVCDKTESYTNTSKFGSNLKDLLSYLSIANLNEGFYSNSVGDGNDTVYGKVQCRGDVTAKVCKGCIKLASDEMLGRCPNKSATIWYDSCLLRYSNSNFLGSSGTPVWVYMWNTGNSSNPVQFEKTLGELMNNLARTAASETWLRMFATGEKNFSSFQNIYGLVQCIRDISANNCSTCLLDAISQIPICCDKKQGGRVFGAVCNVRYEVYNFFNESTIAEPAPSPAPSPSANSTPPSTNGTTTDTVALPPPFRNTSSTNEKTAGTKHNSSRIIAILVPTITSAVILFVLFASCLLRKTSLQKKKKNTTAIDVIEVADKSFLVNFDRLRAATNDFSNENKLGEGGFGPVYKATLANGQEIAVKRLSVNSGQGILEFRNEVALIAKLHHKNLVRLFGCCVEGEEKLLIYEYIPNRSLDYFLFDPMKSDSLNWECRYKIIGGIARGLLYLHEESQLKIIHRDLKASNILLDANMNPKISDFGMAKIFQLDQTQANTSRIAGTYGYMSPEYVTNGQFSVKSDVFSFGVLLLEIVSGQKNNTFYQTNLAEDLLSYVWRAWTNGTVLEIIDSSLSRHFPRSKAMRCIHIGLLCVQNDQTARPNISSVVVMLNSFSITIPAPSPPAFFISSAMEPSLQLNYSKQENSSDPLLEKSKTTSTNGASITELEPR